MRTFTVEGQHWLKDVEIDNDIFDDYSSMAFEAMTQGVEGFFKGEYEEEYNGQPALGLFLIAYERGCGMDDMKKMSAMTEIVLYNAGYHSLGQEFKKISIEEMDRERKNNRKKP